MGMCLVRPVLWGSRKGSASQASPHPAPGAVTLDSHTAEPGRASLPGGHARVSGAAESGPGEWRVAGGRWRVDGSGGGTRPDDNLGEQQVAVVFALTSLF